MSDQTAIETYQKPEADQLRHIDWVDRSGWGPDYYKSALRVAIEYREYSQWIIGMLVTEIMKRWPQTTYELLAHEMHGHIKASTLKSYATTYVAFIKDDPDYDPNGDRLPWTSRVMIKNHATKTGKSASEVAKELEDKNVTSPNDVYRALQEAETGRVLPRKPNFPTTVNNNQTAPFFNITVPEYVTKESLEATDLKAFQEDLTAILGYDPFK